MLHINSKRLRGALPVFMSLVVFLISCSAPGDEGEGASVSEDAASSNVPDPNPDRNPYFGDLHVHTRFSFDAYLFSVRANPDDAYRYAKGEAITHPAGFPIQLKSGPLDFQAVTDHDLYLGAVAAMDDENSSLYDTPLGQELREAFKTGGGFARAIQALRSGEFAELPADNVEAVARSAWQNIIEAAERHNDPGRFTTFVAYEFTATSGADRGNLHRNVVFRDHNVPELPHSAVTSPDPKHLWDWLDAQRAQGIEGLAIPHNSNGSNGHMFQLSTFDGEPLDADYAAQRNLNEPLVEITQVKGDSETHPMLSPNDEWADFETFPYRIATTLYSEPNGGYVRQAWLNGLELEENEGYNPFRFGVVGATDTHNAGGTPEEDNYHSKVGVPDSTPQRRGSVPLDEPRADGGRYADVAFDKFGAAGLAGVWAEENTRESIYDAFRRKETFATTGPRIPVRFFAGFGYSEGLTEDADMIKKAYEGGTPMGGDLLAKAGDAPRFLVWAARDPHSAPLQRIQIIKGWVEDGKAREAVIDVACSDGLAPDEQGRCPDNGASVNLEDCSISADKGSTELKALWSDPDFDVSQRALYYVRVLENPTCRWSTWDAVRAGVAPREDLYSTIQERAYSSPIWVRPGGE